MKVVLEGTDATGKSTLASSLEHESGYGIYHSTSNTKNDHAYHRYLTEKDGPIVYDRFHLGEIVWPIIFDREPKMTYEEIIDISKRVDVIIIFYASDDNVLVGRMCARNETIEDIENSLIANRIYKYLIDSLPLDNIIPIDVSKDNTYEKTKHLYY